MTLSIGHAAEATARLGSSWSLGVNNVGYRTPPEPHSQWPPSHYANAQLPSTSGGSYNSFSAPYRLSLDDSDDGDEQDRRPPSRTEGHDHCTTDESCPHRLSGSSPSGRQHHDPMGNKRSAPHLHHPYPMLTCIRVPADLIRPQKR